MALTSPIFTHASSQHDDPFSRWVPSFLVDHTPTAAEACVAAGGRIASIDANIPSTHRRCFDPQGGSFFLRERSDKERAVDRGWTNAAPPPGVITWLDSLANNGIDNRTDGAGEEDLATFYAKVLSLDTDVTIPFPGGRFEMLCRLSCFSVLSSRVNNFFDETDVWGHLRLCCFKRQIHCWVFSRWIRQ